MEAGALVGESVEPERATRGARAKPATAVRAAGWTAGEGVSIRAFFDVEARVIVREVETLDATGSLLRAEESWRASSRLYVLGDGGLLSGPSGRPRWSVSRPVSATI